MRQEDVLAAMAALPDGRSAKVGQSYLSELERAEHDRRPSGDVAVALALVLGTTTDYLFGLSADPEAEESAKVQLEAAAAAERQRGGRADRLRMIAARGREMLTTEDAAAANAWFRRYVRVWVRDNSVVRVHFP
jgi:transcriptional regulator with XRE-family HTH domain